MYLRTIAIKNYLSLADIRLEKLGQLNVLIGRNNSGKSAVFGALSFLGKTVNNQGVDRDQVDMIAVLTNRDSSRSLEIHLEFEPSPADRKEFIDLFLPEPAQANKRLTLIDSAFLRKVAFTFRSPAGLPHLLHLRETRVFAEDAQWSMIQEMKPHDNYAIPNPTSRYANIFRVARKTQRPFGSSSSRSG